MAYKFIFEDEEETPSSQLLKSSFNGNNIYFSNGCAKLLNKLNEIYNKEDTFIVFYDVSINNQKTVLGFEDLKQQLLSKGMRNVAVIPFICIEQIIANTLIKYNYLGKQKAITQNIIDNIITNFDWDKVSNSIKYYNNTYEQSLEHIYKRFLQEQIKRCLHNTINSSNNLFEKFYTYDCNCNQIYCNVKSQSGLSVKAEQLYTMLPIFSIISDKHKEYISKININVISNNIAQAKMKQQSYYNKIYENMKSSNSKNKDTYTNIKV